MNPQVLAMLDSLREQGADRFDPVAWHHIEVLAKRGLSQTPSVQSLLEIKIQQALDLLQSRMSSRHAPCVASTEPASARPTALAALLQALSGQGHSDRLSSAADHPVEKPRVRQFRHQLGKISAHKQVSQAIAQAPQNAGPINSHMLVLRSLGLMRDISPDYLSRFMGYVDTLLRLDDAGKAKTVTGRKADEKTLKPDAAATAHKR